MYVIYIYDNKVKADVAIQHQTIENFLQLAGISDKDVIKDVYSNLATYGDYSHEGFNGDVITIHDKYFVSSAEISEIYNLGA